MRQSSGTTLVEIVISVLLAAIMTTAVFSIALTAKSESKITEEHNMASQSMDQLSVELKNYVTAYYSYSTNSFIGNMAEIPGPSCPTCSFMSGTPSQWTWASVVVPPNTSPVVDSCGVACYVLQVGVHTLTNYLPPMLSGRPYNATISYTVTAPVNSSNGPGVAININWNTPAP